MSGPETIRLDMPGWSNPTLPVLVYRGVVPQGDPAAVEAVLAGNGWPPGWRNGVYPFHHFHSTAHEALACAAGSATLTLGGPDGREGCCQSNANRSPPDALGSLKAGA